jgi:hypothetical protein
MEWIYSHGQHPRFADDHVDQHRRHEASVLPDPLLLLLRVLAAFDRYR